jgi:hypothetical protein
MSVSPISPLSTQYAATFSGNTATTGSSGTPANLKPLLSPPLSPTTSAPSEPTPSSSTVSLSAKTNTDLTATYDAKGMLQGVKRNLMEGNPLYASEPSAADKSHNNFDAGNISHPPGTTTSANSILKSR